MEGHVTSMERKEGALVCVFLDDAGRQEKQMEEAVQSGKDPVLVFLPSCT